MKGFVVGPNGRDLVETIMTGFDDEVARSLLERRRLDPGAKPMTEVDDAGFVARVRPARSIHSEIAATQPLLLKQIEKVPGAAQAVQALCVSLWEFAFRGKIAYADCAVRDTRTAAGETEIHYTIAKIGDTRTAREMPHDPDFGRFIARRSAQMADVYAEVVGLPEAVVETLTALRTFAVRHGYPINQVGMKDGRFRPTAGGGELRFSCYYSPPR